jgi:hypothetical protein
VANETSRRKATEAAATEAATAATTTAAAVMSSLILKRAATSRPSGQWSDDDFDVLEDGVVVGRISKEQAAPQGRPWMGRRP